MCSFEQTSINNIESNETMYRLNNNIKLNKYIVSSNIRAWE